MTWPAGAVNTANTDSLTDSPANARADFLDLEQKVNLIIANGEPMVLAGSQTVAGTKTFSSPPVIPAPSAGNHPARKGETDAALLAGLQALSGGWFHNLVLSANGTNASVSVSADAIVLISSSFAPQVVVPSFTISSAASGANGLDTGSITSNTWYSVWAIWNGTTTAGLLSLSSTSPTLPSGYTHKARVGWIRTDGSGNKYPLAFDQDGQSVAYRVAAGTNVTSIPIVAAGAQGSVSVPTWVSSSLSSFIPPTAKRYTSFAQLNSALSNHCVMIAPSSAYGPYGTTTNPAPHVLDIPNFGGYCPSSQASMRNLDGNIYYMSDGAGGKIGVIGWEDNL